MDDGFVQLKELVPNLQNYIKTGFEEEKYEFKIIVESMDIELDKSIKNVF